MSVLRVNKTKDFTVMSNYHFRDKRISLKAKGLLSQILSLPEGWNYSITGLASINKENETAIETALKELRKFGYVKISKRMPNETESGRIEYTYDIYEQPQEIQESEKQGVEILPLEIQGVENRPQYNTKESNTNISNTNNKSASRNSKKLQTSCEKIIEDFCETCEEQNKECIKDLLYEWLNIRKFKRAANTSRAIAINLNKLRELSNKSGLSIEEYLKQVVARGWAAFFEIPNFNKTQSNTATISSFDTNDFFELALRRSYRQDEKKSE